MAVDRATDEVMSPRASPPLTARHRRGAATPPWWARVAMYAAAALLTACAGPALRSAGAPATPVAPGDAARLPTAADHEGHLLVPRTEGGRYFEVMVNGHAQARAADPR